MSLFSTNLIAFLKPSELETILVSPNSVVAYPEFSSNKFSLVILGSNMEENNTIIMFTYTLASILLITF